jgi:hypothetical protein
VRYFLWNLWIPDYEGGGPWYTAARARLMWWVRKVWYRGKTQPCMCGGCEESVPMASASGLCLACATENCEHEEKAPEPIGHCPKCGIAWYSSVGYCGGCRTKRLS